MITKEEYIKKIEEMIPDVTDLILLKANSLWNSGAIDKEEFENNYILPKIVLSAIGLEIHWRYCPIDKKLSRLPDLLFKHFI